MKNDGYNTRRVILRVAIHLKKTAKCSYYLEFWDVIQAILFEKQIKGSSRAKKIALINDDFITIQELAECRNCTHYKYKPNSDD